MHFDFKEIVGKCEVFHEMTGEVGDVSVYFRSAVFAGEGDDEKLTRVSGDWEKVVLIHPLMLHSASHNNLRHARIITNPPVSLNQPFNFHRTNPSEYSLIELKTLQDLGRTKEEGFDFKITRERERVTPGRMLVQNPMKDLELIRLRERGIEVTPDEVVVI